MKNTTTNQNPVITHKQLKALNLTAGFYIPCMSVMDHAAIKAAPSSKMWAKVNCTTCLSIKK